VSSVTITRCMFWNATSFAQKHLDEIKYGNYV